MESRIPTVPAAKSATSTQFPLYPLHELLRQGRIVNTKRVSHRHWPSAFPGRRPSLPDYMALRNDSISAAVFARIHMSRLAFCQVRYLQWSVMRSPLSFDSQWRSGTCGVSLPQKTLDYFCPTRVNIACRITDVIRVPEKSGLQSLPIFHGFNDGAPGGWPVRLRNALLCWPSRRPAGGGFRGD